MKIWSYLVLAASCSGLPAVSASPQQPQYWSIPAPSPRSNYCSIVVTHDGLKAKMSALSASGIPPIDFSRQSAVVATTSDGFAVPQPMGPSASDPATLLLTFSRGANASASGVFVLAIDAKYATRFTGCRVAYGATAPAPMIQNRRTRSGPTS